MAGLSKRSTIVVLFTVLIIFLVNIAWWFFYVRTADSFEYQLNHRLSSIASFGAASIDPAMIDSLKEGYLSAYDNTLEILDRLQRSDSLSEVFILDYNYNYLANTSIQSDSIYNLLALNGHYVDSVFMVLSYDYDYSSLVTDGYPVGNIILKSAFAPIFDSTGAAVAVLGIEADVDYTDVLFDLKRNLLISTSISIGAGLLFGIFFFLIQRRINAAEKSLFMSRAQANLGRMVAVVSHEIKNPLMIVRASAERLLKKHDDNMEADFIIEETDRLNKILTGYLDFAGGSKTVNPEDVEISSLLFKLHEQFARRLKQEGTELVLNNIKNEQIINADPVALRQILINLVLNGAEASKGNDNSEVIISAQNENDYIVITVSDNGAGIAAKDLKSLFEPFYTTKTTGSGLGLFLSRRLIEQMNGKIEVDSRPGGPTVFSLKLVKKQ